MKLSRAVVCALGALSLAACDIPTNVPKIDQRWIIPAKSTTIDVGQLLPTGVTISGSVFAVNVGAISVSQSLGQSCPGCAALNGQPNVPVPGFQSDITNSSNLPANVTGATLSAGSVNVTIQNNFGFDPLTNGDSATITLTSGRTIGYVRLTTIKTGSTQLSIPLTPGSVGGSITAKTSIYSKGGQPATINTNNTISVTATPTGIQVSSATVGVAGKAFNFNNQDLSTNIDASLVDHVQSGSLILTITNPFGVAMTANFDITVPNGPTIHRQVSVTNATTSTVTLTYSGDELKSFLGKDGVKLSGTGSIAAGSPAITVTPTQKVGLDAKLDLTIEVG